MVDTESNVLDAIARLRSALARALVDETNPYDDPLVRDDLSELNKVKSSEFRPRIDAFIETLADPESLPGLSRQVVFARGQRFLLSLAIDLEDRASQSAPKKSKKTDAKKTAPAPLKDASYDPALLDLAGIGPKTAARLSSRGIASPRDLLFVLPRRYDDRREVTPISGLKPGMRAVTEGEVEQVRVYGRPWKPIMSLELRDGEDTVRGMWFGNRRPRSDRFEKGLKVTLAGLVSRYKGRLQIAHPIVIDDPDASDRIGRVVPVYPEVPGVAGRTLEKGAQSAAKNAEDIVADPLPEFIKSKRDLMGLAESLRLVHCPPLHVSIAALDAWVDGSSPAHRRLAYDEFFYVQLALLGRRSRAETKDAPRIDPPSGVVKILAKEMAITPTLAQRRVVEEIHQDMAKPTPMQRLLQGDVGSGKTFVALAAVAAVALSGRQVALMAPTEILAEQHMRTLYPVLANLGIPAALHIGSARSSTRKKTLAAFETGKVRVAIGTHALIQEAVSFRALSLAIVDEQHRFGVSQRLGLVGKGPDGTSPHLLVMTATPIPRTLALTVHGDLDISSIDELPEGRTPVTTRVWSNQEREEVVALAAETVARGQQVFVVCPIIEESEKLDLRAAEDVYEEYADRFGEARCRLLHGRLGPDEKEAAMGDFAAGRADVLVTTTVVEVGVDVPNATMMIVEGAERFGLAQLHQLRGRVGRSNLQSECHLISDATNEDAVKRLGAITETTDGFRIAEADLEIRGPGELYGRRQAGLPGFRFGHLIRDAALLSAARDDAHGILASDPALESASGNALKAELARRILAEEGPVGEEAG